MALTGKLISLDRVFHKFFQDFPFSQEFSVPEAVEICGHTLDLIAAPRQYFEKITDGNAELNHPCPIVIDKYRGVLPKDIISITQIKDEATGVPLRESTDNFHINLQVSEEFIPDTPDLSDFGQESLEFDSPLTVAQNKLKDGSQTSLTYTINGCYIFTNFEEGSLVMSYKAFPVDCNGYPLYPDNAKYTQALVYAIAENIAQKLWLQDKLSKDKFEYIQQQRNFYIGAATTAGLSKSIDGMESWKNMYLRMIPQIHAHSTGFKYISDTEERHTKNSI